MLAFYVRAPIKHTLLSVRIQTSHVTSFHRQRRDQIKQIAGVLQGRQLPVAAVAAPTHDPGDEGCGQTRLEDDAPQSKTIGERLGTHCQQRFWKSEGSEALAVHEGLIANSCQSIWEY